MWPVLIVLAVAVVVLTLIALAAVVFAVVIHLVPFFLIVLGVYLLVRAVLGPRRHRNRAAPPMPQRYRGERRPAPRPAATPRPATPTPEPRPRPRRELPIDVQVKVEQIRRKAEVLLGYADRFPAFSQDLYVVRQTAAEYLPRTIAAYQAVPGVDEPILGSAGQTALEELRAQLQLLDTRLDEIAQDLQRQDLDHLIANRRFLEERFGLRDRPAQPDPDAPPTDAGSRSAVGSA